MRIAAILIALTCLAGCGEEEVRVYRVAKGSPVAAPKRPGPSLRLHWNVPAGWKEMPGSGMRAATFVMGEGKGLAELSVVPLRGVAGGPLANVNRWRGQIGLGPTDGEGLALGSESIETGAGAALLVDITGPRVQLVAAILETRGQTWFFKLSGPKGAPGAHKKAFRAFLGSLHHPE